MEIAAQGSAKGRAGTETIFLLDEEANLQRRPDAFYVSFKRWPADHPIPHSDPWPVVPDLAAEVISKSNLAEDILDKVAEYLRAGVGKVWVIYPRQRQVYEYIKDAQPRVYQEADELDGGEVLPGFRLPLAALFGQEVVSEADA
jgi:Uma2 family endonuclease